jgi:hypothetical protein
LNGTGAPPYVENDLDMRIHPPELDYRALQLVLVIAIVSGVRVMRENCARYA